MVKKIELAVVIPVFNEEGAVIHVLDKWASELRRLDINYQIHVYNDGSSDNTLTLLNGYAAGRERIIVHDKKNSGHGPTILLAYRENVDKKWIFQVDSDDEIEPDKFQYLWEKRKVYDFLTGRRNSFNAPVPRRIISFISRLVVSAFYGRSVYDVNMPFRLMRSEAFKDIFFALPDNMFAPNVAISGMVSLRKMRVYEVPIQKRERRTGEVSIRKFKLFKAAVTSFVQTILFRFEGKKRLRDRKGIEAGVPAPASPVTATADMKIIQILEGQNDVRQDGLSSIHNLQIAPGITYAKRADHQNDLGKESVS